MSQTTKKPVSWVNILVGAGVQTFEVSTLGQPFEVVKTHMERYYYGQNLTIGSKQRGWIEESYQENLPTRKHSWILPGVDPKASTKGAVLLYASSEIEYYSRANFGVSLATAGLLGGCGGGIAQAYTSNCVILMHIAMGFCTFMKTVEVTRHKGAGVEQRGTIQVAMDVWRKEGIAGLNKGVTAVALRQMTNWGSRFGIARVTESLMKGKDKQRKLKNSEKLAASAIGGALACWNQPIEVIRVEMQSQKVAADRPKNMNIFSCARYIYKNNGLAGFYRGVTPRVALGVYLTICMVFGGDQLKEAAGRRWG